MSKRRAILFCLVGPAGGGKTTLADKILTKYKNSMKVSISATSREARPGEVDGQSYYFLTREEFEKRVAESQFFEWEENHGNLYGTLKSAVEQARQGESDLLLVIDIRGAITIKKTFPKDTVIIFLTPPSYKELVSRLDMRGKLSSDERMRRLQTTERELKLLKENFMQDSILDYLVINDKIEHAELELLSIVEAERLKIQRLSEQLVSQVTTINKD